MKYFLYSKESCIAEYDRQTKLLEPTESIAIPENTLVKIFYENPKFLPFCFKTNNYFPLKNYYNILKFNNFTIIELSPTKLFTAEVFKTKTLGKFTVTVLGSPYKVNINEGTDFYSFESKTPLLHNLEISDQKNVICIESFSNNTNFVVLFHKKEKRFYAFLGDITLSTTGITAVTDEQTLAQHGTLETYEITSETIRKISTEPVYLNGCPASIPPSYIHIAFFEAVRLKDFTLAKSYLTRDFASRLSSAHFEKFFGTFEIIKSIRAPASFSDRFVEAKVYNNSPEKFVEEDLHYQQENINKFITKIALLSKDTPNNYTGRLFTLTLSHNLISDIVED